MEIRPRFEMPDEAHQPHPAFCIPLPAAGIGHYRSVNSGGPAI
jgi:hypothetical protein